MSPLIETIRLFDGEFNNLPYHAARLKRAWENLFHIPPPFDLKELVSSYPIPSQGLFKCRITYDTEVRDIEILHYQVKPVTSLKLVYDDTISYHHKFKDRSALDLLFAQRGPCDDVLIIRNGLVTDTSYANIVFKKNDAWFTPATYLLQGTMRQSLIDRKMVEEREITVDEIPLFDSFKLINSMLMWELPELATSCVVR